MARHDITKDGPLNYRQLQELNKQEYTPNTEDLSRRIYESIMSGNRLRRASESSSAPVSVNSTSAANYWGWSSYDQDTATADEFAALDDVRAREQSAFTKIAFGTAKGAVLAGTTIANLGAIINPFTYIAGHSAFNNPTTQAINEINDYLEKEVLVNHMSNFEKNADWTKNIWTANFLGNTLIKNYGFTIGAMIASGGTSLLANAVRLPALISRLTSSAVVGRAAVPFVASTIGAISEASIEASHAAKHTYDMGRAKLIDEHNRTIQAIKETYGDSEMAQALYKAEEDALNKSILALEEEANKAANVTAYTQLPILMASGLMQFGKVWGGGYNALRRAANIVRNAKGGFESTGRSLVKGIGKGIANTATEAGEEVFQKFASTAGALYVDDDILNNYRSALSNNEIYAANMDVEAEEEAVGLLESYAKSISETAQDGNTYLEAFLGALTGAVGIPGLGRRRDGSRGIQWQGGIINEVKDYQQETKRLQELAADMTERIKAPEFQKYYQGLVRHIHYDTKMGDALKEGDQETYEEAEHAQVVSDLLMFDSAGHLGTYLESVKAATDGITDEDIEEIIKSTSKKVTDKRQNITHVSMFEGINNTNTPSAEDKKKARAQIQETRDKLLSTIDKYIAIRDELTIDYGDILADDAYESLILKYMQLESVGDKIIQNSNNPAHKKSNEVTEAVEEIKANKEKKLRDRVTEKQKALYELLNPDEKKGEKEEEKKQEDKSSKDKTKKKKDKAGDKKSTATPKPKPHEVAREQLATLVYKNNKLLTEIDAILNNPNIVGQEREGLILTTKDLKAAALVAANKEILSNITGVNHLQQLLESVQISDPYIRQAILRNIASLSDKHARFVREYKRRAANRKLAQDMLKGKRGKGQLIEDLLNVINSSTEEDLFKHLNDDANKARYDALEKGFADKFLMYRKMRDEYENHTSRNKKRKEENQAQQPTQPAGANSGTTTPSPATPVQQGNTNQSSLQSGAGFFPSNTSIPNSAPTPTPPPTTQGSAITQVPDPNTHTGNNNLPNSSNANSNSSSGVIQSTELVDEEGNPIIGYSISAPADSDTPNVELSDGDLNTLNSGQDTTKIKNDPNVAKTGQPKYEIQNDNGKYSITNTTPVEHPINKLLEQLGAYQYVEEGRLSERLKDKDAHILVVAYTFNHGGTNYTLYLPVIQDDNALNPITIEGKKYQAIGNIFDISTNKNKIASELDKFYEESKANEIPLEDSWRLYGDTKAVVIADNDNKAVQLSVVDIFNGRPIIAKDEDGNSSTRVINSSFFKVGSDTENKHVALGYFTSNASFTLIPAGNNNVYSSVRIDNVNKNNIPLSGKVFMLVRGAKGDYHFKSIIVNHLNENSPQAFKDEIKKVLTTLASTTEGIQRKNDALNKLSKLIHIGKINGNDRIYYVVPKDSGKGSTGVVIDGDMYTINDIESAVKAIFNLEKNQFRYQISTSSINTFQDLKKMADYGAFSTDMHQLLNGSPTVYFKFAEDDTPKIDISSSTSQQSITREPSHIKKTAFTFGNSEYTITENQDGVIEVNSSDGSELDFDTRVKVLWLYRNSDTIENSSEDEHSVFGNIYYSKQKKEFIVKPSEVSTTKAVGPMLRKNNTSLSNKSSSSSHSEVSHNSVADRVKELIKQYGNLTIKVDNNIIDLTALLEKAKESKAQSVSNALIAAVTSTNESQLKNALTDLYNQITNGCK